jgi:hypothetical protein
VAALMVVMAKLSKMNDRGGLFSVWGREKNLMFFLTIWYPSLGVRDIVPYFVHL